MKHTFKSRLPTVFHFFCPFECCRLHEILFYFAQVQELAEREAQLILIDQHHAECARLLNEQRQTLIERESELIQREAALGSLCFTHLSTPHSFVYSILLVFFLFLLVRHAAPGSRKLNNKYFLCFLCSCLYFSCRCCLF